MSNVEWAGSKGDPAAEVVRCVESTAEGRVYVPFDFVRKYFDVRKRKRQ